MKSKPVYGKFTETSAVFSMTALENIIYDICEDLGFVVHSLRFDPTKKQFDVRFTTFKKDDDWKHTREMCS